MIPNPPASPYYLLLSLPQVLPLLHGGRFRNAWTGESANSSNHMWCCMGITWRLKTEGDSGVWVQGDVEF